MIYMDNSATTQPANDILQTFVAVQQRFFANPASIHPLGLEANELIEKSRQQMRSLVGLKEGPVVLTSGGTEANNLAVIGIARHYQYRGKHILTTAIEHPSVIEAMKQLENEGFTVDYLPVDEEGVISLNDVKRLIQKETILVSIMHVNNEIGSIQPIEEIGSWLKQTHRALFHVDAVQSFSKLPIEMNAMGIDALSISAHKIQGVKGSGALFLQPNCKVSPMILGGGQEDGLRSGTVSPAHAACLAKAMRLSLTHTPPYLTWRQYIIRELKALPTVRILAENCAASHILALSFPEIKGEVALNFFQQQGICVSTSSACSAKSDRVSHVIEALALADDWKYGVIRLSFGPETKEAEIDRCIEVIKQFIAILERGKLAHAVE